MYSSSKVSLISYIRFVQKVISHFKRRNKTSHLTMASAKLLFAMVKAVIESNYFIERLW